MTTRERLETILSQLSEQRLSEVLDYATFLGWLDARLKRESDEWQHFSLTQLTKAYDEDEPEYTEADLKSRPPHEPR
jgi:hypothetical protein